MDHVTYPRAKIIEVLRSIEEIVVSLDRIGSCARDMTPDEQHRALSDFVDSHDVFRKLAEARSILSEPFPTSPGPDDTEELEREMQGITFWSRRNPPNAAQSV